MACEASVGFQARSNAATLGVEVVGMIALTVLATEEREGSSAIGELFRILCTSLLRCIAVELE